MKTSLLFLLGGLSLLRIDAAQREAPVALERGPHHAVWQWITPEGETNQFTELCTGMNRWKDDAWVPSAAVIEEINGSYVARQTAHQVIFADGASAAAGTIDLELPDGGRFRVRPLGIAFTEFDGGKPGKSAFVAELQDSKPELTAPNQVTYVDAMEGVDLQYDLSLAGLEQNVVIRRRLPSPGTLGLSDKLARVEIWNEVLESPKPAIQAMRMARADGSIEDDQQIDLGTMQFAAGRAFAVGESKPAGPVQVTKSWAVIDGKTWLIESVPYAQFEVLMKSLPAAHASAGNRFMDAPEQSSAGNGRRFPSRRMKSDTAQVRKPVGPQVARLQREARPAAVLDWTLLASPSNFIFKGDTTYYVNGTVNLTGTSTIIEGGTVVKFTNSASAKISIASGSVVDCRTSPYRPAVFTSKDDNSVGEAITGSTGNPVGYYGSPCLEIYGCTLKNLRFSYANTAVTLATAQTLTVQDSQFVKCLNGFLCYNQDTINLENSLFHGLDTLITGQQNNSINGVNLTVHDCATLATLGAGSIGSLINSLLVKIANSLPPWTLDHTPDLFLTSDFAIFLSVGAGANYLQYDNSVTPLRNAGNNNISPALLARLSQKTTYPPAVLTSGFTGNTVLKPVIPRDDDGQIDLGYHYDPIDYAWSGLSLTGATLTLTNGVAVAIYGQKGTTLQTGGKFVSQGDPIRLNRLTRYNTVQEQPVIWGSVNNSMSLIDSTSSSAVETRLIFTDVSLLAPLTTGAPWSPTLRRSIRSMSRTRNCAASLKAGPTHLWDPVPSTGRTTWCKAPPSAGGRVTPPTGSP